MEVCRGVLSDGAAPPGDRAVALCWIAHIVGDLHQPCHAGSLYAPKAFRDGDRGANEIATTQRGNLHALWDGLLGPRFSEGAINRRLAELKADGATMARGRALAGVLSPLAWIDESREAARRTVYTAAVLAPVRAVAEGRADTLPTIRLSPEYLETAGRMARLRACHAGHRLAEVWAADLTAANTDRTPGRPAP